MYETSESGQNLLSWDPTVFLPCNQSRKPVSFFFKLIISWLKPIEELATWETVVDFNLCIFRTIEKPQYGSESKFLAGPEAKSIRLLDRCGNLKLLENQNAEQQWFSFFLGKHNLFFFLACYSQPWTNHSRKLSLRHI